MKTLKPILYQIKKRLYNQPRDEGELNILQKGIKRVEKENQKIYAEGKEKHDRMIRFLKEKGCNAPKAHTQSQSECIRQVAKGDGREKTQPQSVPIFGEVQPPLEKDEAAAASRPSDFVTLGRITLLPRNF